jgi:hypothetical protein
MNAVITYIFGHNTEILRAPLYTDDNTEYICVTDNKDLSSEHWNVIYDTMPHATCPRDKMVYVKYNPFGYTNAENIVLLDGSLQIHSSLGSLFNMLSNHRILVKRHPCRDNLLTELDEWHRTRNLPAETITKFKAMASIDGIDLRRPHLIESCLLAYKRTVETTSLCNTVLTYMNFLGVHPKLCLTNQCVLTYLIYKLNIPVGWINQHLYCTRYYHNTWKPIKE